MMSARITPVVWTAFFALSALALYLVKYKVQEVRDEVVALERELNGEEESLAMLQAEWAYLNRPDRLQQLSDHYLKMQPASAAIISWQEVPLRNAVLAAHEEKR